MNVKSAIGILKCMPQDAQLVINTRELEGFYDIKYPTSIDKIEMGGKTIVCLNVVEQNPARKKKNNPKNESN